MRRAHPTVALLLAALCALAGCGRTKPQEELSFEKLPDTTGLSDGAAILESFEPYRMANGAMRVTGRVRLPDGTKLQIAVKQPGGKVSVAMAHVFVRERQFDSPPLVGDRGALPNGDYRFELLAHFTPDWQTAEVLRATGDGRNLRGPGITRARDGAAAFFLIQKGHL
jgi:hypothetical protein